MPFYAIEHVECLAMQTFLCQLQMRVTLSSVLWLHDGVWIPDTVTKEDIQFAERATLQELSLSIDDTCFFQVRALDEPAQRARNSLRSAPRGDAPAKGRVIDPPEFTRDHPHAQLQTARVSHDNDDEYLDRMNKRPRVFWMVCVQFPGALALQVACGACVRSLVNALVSS